jgi:lysozyme family protein
MNQQILEFLFKWEGGAVNDPDDHGGKTNFGVTQATYDRYSKIKGLPLRDVFGMSQREAEDVYGTLYWMPCGADFLDMPLSMAVFDTAVNFGVFRAVQFLQSACGAKVDGILGPKTVALAKLKPAKSTALKIVTLRLAYRDKRVAEDPTQLKFLKGWKNRDNDLKKEILKFDGQEDEIEEPKVSVIPKKETKFE